MKREEKIRETINPPRDRAIFRISIAPQETLFNSAGPYWGWYCSAVTFDPEIGPQTLSYEVSENRGEYLWTSRGATSFDTSLANIVTVGQLVLAHKVAECWFVVGIIRAST